MQPAFFAHELKPGAGAGGEGKVKNAKRFDWLHYRYEGIALQACLMVGPLHKLNPGDSTRLVSTLEFWRHAASRGALQGADWTRWKQIK
jgi:hypothetical protein